MQQEEIYEQHAVERHNSIIQMHVVSKQQAFTHVIYKTCRAFTIMKGFHVYVWGFFNLESACCFLFFFI